jgi:hypothetical protein
MNAPRENCSLRGALFARRTRSARAALALAALTLAAPAIAQLLPPPPGERLQPLPAPRQPLQPTVPSGGVLKAADLPKVKAGEAPQGVAITGSTPTTVSLSWQPVQGAQRFEVVATSQYGPVALTTLSSSANGATVAGAFDSRVQYELRVRAFYSDKGPGESAPLTFTPPAPRAPTRLTAVQQGRDVVLSWDPVPGAATYLVVGETSADTHKVQAPRRV